MQILLIPEHLLWPNELNGVVVGDGALVRKRSYELVIHITSIGEFHFFFILPFFPIYNSLQRNLEFCTIHTDFSLFFYFN